MMAQHYPNAPITEAIIDLRVEIAEEKVAAHLKQVGESVRQSYPQQDELLQAIGQMELRHDGTSASAHQSLVGFRSANVDQTQIMQTRRNGFTFSRLAPYDRWQPFRDEARRLWTIYRQKLEPSSIVRLAVRYINRVDIPGETVDLKEYFRTSPNIAPELPQELDGFFMQLRLPIPQMPVLALINQTIVPPSRDGVVSVVLDIDLFRTQETPQDEHAIWEFFEVLHDKKNSVFEACITDSARRLFTSCRS